MFFAIFLKDYYKQDPVVLFQITL